MHPVDRAVMGNEQHLSMRVCMYVYYCIDLYIFRLFYRCMYVCMYIYNCFIDVCI